jgi:predicted RNase H-like nuclease (RuvC/YqgF family)
MARVRRSEENSIGINWSLKYRNKISELEHKLEDTEKHNRELIRKVKKYTKLFSEIQTSYSCKPLQKLLSSFLI